MMQLHIHRARVIDPQSDFHNEIVDILVEGGIIKSIEKPTGKNQKSAIVTNDKEVWSNAKNKNADLCISPGWVDVFADYSEPGYEHKETIATGLNAAAAGGFTDVFLAPNTQPAVSTKSVAQFILQKSAGNIVNLHPLGCITQNCGGKELAEMMDMHHNGVIAFTDGWKPVQNIDLTLKAMEYLKAFGGVTMQLPIDATLSEGGLMNEGIVSTQLGMPGIPALAETLMVHRDIELLRYTGSKLHLTGITTAASVEMIRKAKQEGLSVTCSVTPYHLALTDDVLTNYESDYKVAPPLRTEDDRMALIQGLADGVIDCIASHHRPQDWDAKTKEFEYAANGMAIQELTFNVIWNAVKEFMSIDRLVEAMTLIPRDIFGMEEQKIVVGNMSTLTIFTTTGSDKLTVPNKRSMAYNNPFTGKELSGKVLGIVNNKQTKLNL